MDRSLNSVLYANRAAAQRHLENRRSALKDCLFARKFDPTNLKVVYKFLTKKIIFRQFYAVLNSF